MRSERAKNTPPGPLGAVKPFQIRGRFFTAVAVRPSGAIDDAFLAALDVQLTQAPNFFDNAPLVIDLDATDRAAPIDGIERLIAALRERKLSLFGVQNGSPEQVAAARAAGLIALQGGREVPVERHLRQSQATQPAPEPEPEPEPEPQASPVTRVITTPVRSGQRIFNDRGDLVVVASVGSGAELIAEGNIHVYGQLRGRALAGVNGDTTARIFCQSLDAELVAISGLYQTSENLGPDIRNQRVQVFLQDETLCIEKLK